MFLALIFHVNISHYFIKSMKTKIKLILRAIPYCIFVYIFLTASFSTAEVENRYDLNYPSKTNINNLAHNNIEKKVLPPGKIRIFMDKDHIKSIVINKQDCTIMRGETNTYGFGFKVGGLHFGMGPEIFYRHSTGINWTWGTQLMVAEYQELCTRFNTGRLSQEEYSEEVYEIIHRSRKHMKDLEQRLKNKKDSFFKELDKLTFSSSLPDKKK
jgi:hypothetical protein